MEAGIYHLLKKRRFLPLFLTQFFGAFNDNAFKLAVLTLISYQLSSSQVQSEQYQAIAGGLFILPFFIFSALAGQIADSFDKAKAARLVKVLELILMITGSMALYYSSIFWMMLVLTGMGIHSTFFGPIKYAILPDHIPKSQLLGATGLIEASTFLAILLGTTLGSLSVGSGQKGHFAMALVIVAALAGLIASLFIPPAPSVLKSKQVDLQIWRSTYRLLQSVHAQKNLLLAILVISWFWLIGAVVLTKLPDYTHYVLSADNTVFAIFLALFSIGIATGSLIINRLLSGRVNLHYIPWMMLGLSLFALDLYFSSRSIKPIDQMYHFSSFFKLFIHYHIAFDLFMMAFCAGLFVVPLYTYLQTYSPQGQRARIIAANNIYNALFMVSGSVVIMILLYFKVTIPQVFLLLSISNAIIALSFRKVW